MGVEVGTTRQTPLLFVNFVRAGRRDREALAVQQLLADHEAVVTVVMVVVVVALAAAAVWTIFR
ncbi:MULTISPECIES: hypothetical protein [unclassified Rhodococcus (in: high G+C Gram-positive bacteria)]|uniref:hypothetical protein n=1 Tax=unclassified Rhodococcus (in: high G+C Gram-positive bacteria) TaxID=192944 RepID=UPI00163A50BA|nr:MULTISPECIES: hypothetical protein [unclassified Rhodococcus (in: high G+C Gram-positive bacteria)]MBC2641902.1 hypothetical protein [Rhodococcus sp. 3A]